MRPTILTALLLLTIAVPASAASDVTYFWADYKPLLNGYSLQGSITTDGVLGPITTADIVGANYFLSGPGGTDMGSASGGASALLATTGFEVGGVIATATQLLMPANSGIVIPDYPGKGQLIYDRFRDATGLLANLDEFTALRPDGIATDNYWSARSGVPPGLNLGGTTSWVVATIPGFSSGDPGPAVPEPTSLVMMGLGLAGVALRYRSAA